MQLIGTGTFTKCYLLNCGKRVVLKSSDPIKECMAKGWFPASFNFPTVDYYGDAGDYVMKHYPKVKSLKNNLRPSEWLKYQQLRKVANGAGFCKSGTEFYHWTDQFKKLTNRTLRSNMQYALEACSNYGIDVCFEISPRNVAVSSTGTLILLDCFFIKSKLLEILNTKRLH